MKPKTLKDLKDNKPTNYNKNCRVAWDDFVYVKDLKAEAVKWVKFLEDGIEQGYFRVIGKAELEAQIRVLKSFFNLTEEDLK